MESLIFGQWKDIIENIIGLILCTTPLYNLDKANSSYYHSTLNSHLQRLDSGKLLLFGENKEHRASVVSLSPFSPRRYIDGYVNTYTYSYIFVDIILIN